MSFRERSAWVMGSVMAAAGLYYVHLAITAWSDGGWTAPAIAVFIPYVVLIIVASIIAQTTLAVTAPKDADAPPDERERPLIDRAGNWSGLVLGSGVVTSLLYFLSNGGDGVLLFHMLMGSLIASQVAEYAFQIVLLRRSV